MYTGVFGIGSIYIRYGGVLYGYVGVYISIWFGYCKKFGLDGCFFGGFGVYLYQNVYIMKRKKPYFIVIDLYDLRSTVILKNVTDVSGMIGIDRRTIRIDEDRIYSHYFVLPRFIN